MIVQIIIFLFVISGSVAGSVFFNKKFEDLLPAHLMIMMLILYFFGLISHLKLGVYFLIVAIVIEYIFSIIEIVRRKKIKIVIRNLVTPAFVVFVIIFCLFTYADVGMLAHSWDEFSHWIDAVKAMTVIDDFVTNPDANSFIQSYPPAMTLLQYFVQRIYLMINVGAEFNEWRVYFMFQVFGISMIMPFLSKEQFKKPFKTISHVALMLLVPLFFYNEYWTTTYIDPFVAILAGAGFCFILFKKEDLKLQYLYTSLLCVTLVLSKDVGLYFAIFISVAFAIDYLMVHKGQEAANMLWGIARVVASIIPLLVSLLTKWTWRNEISNSGAKVIFGNKIDIIHYTHILLFNDDTTYHQQVADNFKKAFVTQYNSLGKWGGSITFFGLFFVFAICLLAIWIFSKREDNLKKIRSNRICVVIVFVAAIFYIYSIGATYISNFSEYEAVILASYQRYMNIVYLMMAFVIVEGFYRYSTYIESSKLLSVCLVMGILAVSPLGNIVRFFNRDTVSESKAFRAQYEPLCELILDKCGEKEDKVFFISEADRGIDVWVMRFSARPVKFYGGESYLWSLGESQFDGDVWSNDKYKTSEEWKELLDCEGYKYIALYKVNDYFKEHFAGVFENPADIDNNTLFRRSDNTGLYEKCE